MAYMGAMLIGTITGGIMLAILGFITLVLSVAVFIDSRRHGMKTGWWIAAVIIYGIYALVPYVIVRVIKAFRKCPSCSVKVSEKDAYCAHCGGKINEINDARTAKIFIVLSWLVLVAVFTATELISAYTH